MANGVRTFTIQINGVQESINAVESLNKQLNTLESRINALQGKAVNVSSKGSSTSTSALNEEEKLLKQIQQTEEKIKVTRKENYQQLLAEKDLLKEAVNDQKQRAAQERLVANTYSNTMKGLKEELADIKSVMQTTDLGSDEFKDLVGRAGQLTDKLKQLEAEYGQFGRNVGNYASAAEGFKNLEITVGNTVREFGSAREAFRTLGEELKALSINGQANTKHADELREAYNKLKSAMDDATLSSKAMDEAMDWMQSFTSMASVGQGFKGFFGIGGDDIQRSIQKLVGLQNVLQGIEKINKQIDAREGFGKYLGSINGSIDKVTNRLLAFNRYLLGTGQAAKAASVAIKGFGTVLKGVGIGLAITAISHLVSALYDLFSSSKKVEEQNKRLQQSFDVLTNEINRRNEALDAAQQAGLISEQEKLTAQFKNQMELLDKQVELLKERAALQGENIGIGGIKEGTSLINEKNMFNSGLSIGVNWQAAADVQINNLEELTTLYGRYTKALKEADAANEDWATALTLSNEEIMQSTEYYQNMRNQMEKMAFGHYVSEVQKLDKAYKDGRISAEFYEKKMKDLKKAMEVDPAYQNALVHLKDLFGENAEAANALAKAIDNIFRSLKRIKTNDILDFKDLAERAMLNNMTEHERKLYEIEKAEKEALEDVTEETYEAEEKRALIRKIANDERKEENERWQKEELEKQQDAQRESQSKAEEYSRKMNEIYQTMYNLRLKMMKDGLNKRLIELEEEKRQTLNKLKSNNIAYLEAERIFAERRAELISDELSNFGIEIKNFKFSLDKSSIDETVREIELEIEKEMSRTPWSQRINDYKLNLPAATKVFKELNENYNKYNKETIEGVLKDTETIFRLKKKAIEDEAKLQADAERERYNNQIDEANKHIKQLEDEYNKEYDIVSKLGDKATDDDRKRLDKSLENLKTASKNKEDAIRNHKIKETQIENEKNNSISELEIQFQRKQSQIISEALDDRIGLFRDFISKMNREIDKQPVYNKWQIVDKKKTLSNYDAILKATREQISGITDAYTELDNRKSSMDEKTYKAELQQLNDVQKSAREVLDKVYEDINNLHIEYLSSINEWIQQIGQNATQIMSSISQITSNHYEKQISEQEKYIEEYQKLLDKQKEATQEYADAVKNIEDELATARGDRRQQLIDALNAEMAAQRASLAQEKKIEKEKEKADEKKKKLEQDQAKAEKRMSVWQARLNAIMAVSMAAVNKWPIPAIPMMAMAAAVGAAQIAAAESQNIPTYGDGGVIQGRSHAEGGVKVLGGQAEVEGGEFITNKTTTANNVELLQFINSKRKKIDVADLLEFYNSGKPAKNISSIRTKFANGGQLPSLRNDIDITDRMYQAMEDYANRPSVVQVVDIIDRTERLNEVKVISGLEV